MLFVLLTALLANAYVFEDGFDADPMENGWVQSNWKSDGGRGKFGWTAGEWSDDSENKGLQTSQDAKFYAITKEIPEFDNEGKSLVFQFTVKHEQKMDCGGAYLKLMGPGVDQENFEGSSDYQIMFGPDICGYSTKRVHAIFNHKGTNLLTTKETACETDEYTHVYTLEVEPTDEYRILIDGDVKSEGSMYDHWEFEQPKMIKDPEVSKPSDWVDEKEIDDPEETKPEDWDQAQTIVDPDAEEPEDWDEEDDGEWEAPMIPNTDYKGPWKAKRIPNTDYKGEWEHPMIDNPEYVQESEVYKRGVLQYVGMEVWQVKAGTIFDNILVTDDKDLAELKRSEIIAGFEAEKAAHEAHKKANEPAPVPVEEDAEDEDVTEDEADEEIDEEEADLDELDTEEELDGDKDELWAPLPPFDEPRGIIISILEKTLELDTHRASTIW